MEKPEYLCMSEELRHLYDKMQAISNSDQLLNYARTISDDEDTAEALAKAITDNTLDLDHDVSSYEKYDVQNKGCSKENPFIISETRGFYTQLEYYILKYLFYYHPCREDIFDVHRQSLHHEGDRWMDCITIRVSSDFLFDDHELMACPMPSKVHEEKYWFDITAGITNIGKS